MSERSSSTLQLRRRWLIGSAVVALAAAACSDTTVNSTFQLNLDRPVDMAFACHGGLRILGDNRTAEVDDVVTVSAQPLASCDVRTQQVPTDAPAAVPEGQQSLADGPSLAPVNYYGLILQSVPGTVSFARFPALPASAFSGDDVSIRDADPLTPGKNGITVGIRPVAIATDSSGCFAVTANAGSRDLSMLDLNSALAFDGKARVSRLEVRIPSTPPTRLDASPSALVAVAELDANASAVDPKAFGDRIGVGCLAVATGQFYVAFPDCHLVAAVAVKQFAGTPAFAEVVAGIRFGSGIPTILDGKDVTCAGAAGDPKPTTIDVQRTLRVLPGSPATVALDTQSMVIGAENSNLLTTVALARSGNPFLLLTQIPLAGAVGVLDVALSPQLGLGNRPDDPDPLVPVDAFGDTDAVGGQFQFAYAVTSDGTVRVADLLTGQECDTQIDPRLLKTKTVRELGCLPVTPMMRRSGARGPGIELPIEGVASAVNIIRVSARASDDPPVVPSARRGSPNTLVGTFGVITSTTGVTYMVDIDDDDKADLVENPTCPVTTNPACLLNIDLATTLPHQLRDLISTRSALPETTTTPPLVDCTSNGPVDGTGLTGGARMNGALSRPAVPEVVAESKAFMLPTMRNVACVPGGTPAPAPVAVPELSFAAFGALDSMGLRAIAERKAAFPDTRALRSEDWRLIWEGALSVDGPNQNIDGPSVRQGTVAAGSSTLTLTDRSRPFCAAGVEAYDIVQLRGCDPQLTGQCGLGRACYVHPDSTTGIGACLPEKNPELLADTCRDFLLSARRYTVAVKAPTPESPPNPMKAGSPSSSELTLTPRKRVLRTSPVDGCTDDRNNAQCMAHAAFEAAQSEPAGTPRSARCEVDDSRKPRDPPSQLKRCVMTCSKDSDCDSSSTCVEGIGDVMGTCMEGVMPPKECVAGVQRYDLRASEAFTVLGSTSGYLHNIIADSNGQCVKKANPDPLQVGRIPLQAPPCTGVPTFETPNPCQTKVTHFEAVADSAPTKRSDVNAILFRNPGLRFHFVDPTYTGDLTGRTDKNPTVTNAPMTFTGLAYALRIAGGFTPLTLRTSAVVPVRVVRGPQQSIWVVDEGDYLSETQTLPSTLGKVFRIESTSLSTVTVLQ
jgi:hypothetical protein